MGRNSRRFKLAAFAVNPHMDQIPMASLQILGYCLYGKPGNPSSISEANT
jgi:hypothetical protein